MKVLIVNGPNINMLGVREPDIYGAASFDDLQDFIRGAARELGIEPTLFQSNCEGAIIDAIQGALGKYDGIVINPAAYAHTSIAMADALKAVAIPAVEVHLTDINLREQYRRISYTSEACLKTICGKGFMGYRGALAAVRDAHHAAACSGRS